MNICSPMSRGSCRTGSMAICQEHVTDSLQALMKADYMLAPNSGHNIRRCIICGKYFMLKSGVHALYCEGACPHAPGYTCRQFGTVEVQKELAKNNPKVKAKLTAFPGSRRICSGELSLRRMPEESRIMCETGSTMRCAARISLLRSFLNKYLLRKCMNIAASPE